MKIVEGMIEKMKNIIYNISMFFLLVVGLLWPVEFFSTKSGEFFSIASKVYGFLGEEIINSSQIKYTVYQSIFFFIVGFFINYKKYKLNKNSKKLYFFTILFAILSVIYILSLIRLIYDI